MTDINEARDTKQLILNAELSGVARVGDAAPGNPAWRPAELAERASPSLSAGVSALEPAHYSQGAQASPPICEEAGVNLLWTEPEKDAFALGMYLFPGNFNEVASIVGNKTVSVTALANPLESFDRLRPPGALPGTRALASISLK